MKVMATFYSVLTMCQAPLTAVWLLFHQSTQKPYELGTIIKPITDFADEETKAQRGCVICSRLQSLKVSWAADVPRW